MKNFYGLILAGGSGTRLWPISRQYYPKQFLTLFGNKTLLQQTFCRLAKVVDPAKIFISTNRIFVDEIVLQLEDFGLCKENIIIQPADKNTGPAVAEGAKKIFDNDPSAVIVTCPADHLIKPESTFIKTLKAGYTIAEKGFLVTFGVKPTGPNSDYGYISLEKQEYKQIESYEAFKVKRFIEKPSMEKSALLIKEGSLWNSGIFVWKAEAILKEIKKFDKDIHESLQDHKKYFLLQSMPIDKSVLEKSSLLWVISTHFDWQDIGSWKALYELLPKDRDNNVVNEWATVFKCHNSLIYGAEGRTLTAIDLSDMIVVDTKDDLLISHRQSVSDIKEALKQTEIRSASRKEHKPLVTIIISTYNDLRRIENTLHSVFNQEYKNIEYIVVDGGSTDGTIDTINKYRYKIEYFLTLPHESFFARINKAISVANGEVIGILNADDLYSDSRVVEDIVKTMEQEKTSIVWGDLFYFNNGKTDRVAMYWRSSPYMKQQFEKGWMPPFPAFFVRKSVYEKYGLFNTKFRVAAEYDLMLRLLEKHHVKSSYLPRVLVKMIGKGITVRNLRDRILGNFESYQSWKENGLEISPMFLLSKNINKILQVIGKKQK